MKTRLYLSGILIITVLITSCKPIEKLDNFDYGYTENNKYLNSFFGLELIIPDNWVVQTKAQTENLSKTGVNLIAGDDENLKAVINASEINTANLLAVFQYEVGAAVDYNPSFMLVAENLKNAPGIKTGSDYLFQARKLLKQSQMQYSQFDDEFKMEIINNQDFYTMNCIIDYMGQRIKQRHYSTIIDRFCLSAIITFTNNEQQTNL